jgi:hypothetical protein
VEGLDDPDLLKPEEVPMTQIRKTISIAMTMLTIGATAMVSAGNAHAFTRNGDMQHTDRDGRGMERDGHRGLGGFGTGLAVGLGAALVTQAIAASQEPHYPPRKYVTQDRPVKPKKPEKLDHGFREKVSVSYGSTEQAGLRRVDDLPQNKARVQNDCRLLQAKVSKLEADLAREKASMSALQGAQNVAISDPTVTGASTSFASAANQQFAIDRLQMDIADTTELLARYQADLARCLGAK